MKGFFFCYSIRESLFLINERLWLGIIFHERFDAFEHFFMGGLCLFEYITEKDVWGGDCDGFM